jgi:hypothetical protein
MRYTARIVLVGSLLVAAACGGDSTTGPGTTGAMSATIDGAHWTSSLGAAASHASGAYGVGGSNSSFTLGIGFADTGVGTYEVSATSPTNLIVTQQGGAAWVANVTGGSGSVTVTSVSATRITGTFNFTAIPLPNSGATGNRTITNGTFDITF